jgi:hypothetical protein
VRLAPCPSVTPTLYTRHVQRHSHHPRLASPSRELWLDHNAKCITPIGRLFTDLALPTNRRLQTSSEESFTVPLVPPASKRTQYGETVILFNRVGLVDSGYGFSLALSLLGLQLLSHNSPSSAPPRTRPATLRKRNFRTPAAAILIVSHTSPTSHSRVCIPERSQAPKFDNCQTSTSRKLC